MTVDLAKSGVISREELERHRVYPCEDRLKKGPVAIIECIQEIPCDPCVHSCPQKAISLRNLSAIPELDREKCVGCALCIPSCPGLAIFVVDMTYSENEALVLLPYEFLPVPKVGEQVEAVDREGNPKAKGRVVKVRIDASTNHTAVLAIAVAKDVALEVRSIRSRHR
jgi:Fe-S-cluster-containing hydrogenase component 2